jgi:hypothetical protein
MPSPNFLSVHTMCGEPFPVLVQTVGIGNIQPNSGSSLF